MVASGARAMAVPLCPELAAAGASIASAAILRIVRPSSSLAPGNNSSFILGRLVNASALNASANTRGAVFAGPMSSLGG